MAIVNAGSAWKPYSHNLLKLKIVTE